ncbi:MAG: CocE/NonD family hydrolase [Eubacterium sp.]|jgi:X-Pro dipeptidyl-peptidase
MYKLRNDFIFEQVFVETPVDTDEDGRLDLISVYIARPKDTTKKVPAVFVANPYLMTCNEDWYKPYPVDFDLDSPERREFYREKTIPRGDPVPIKARTVRGKAESNVVSTDIEFECLSDLYPILNDRGYATVFCGGLGTRGSEGITLTGSDEEILAFKSVIDWLCGRARAFTDKTSCIAIEASWCTGKIAMSGKSYLGTLCISLAATGVEGLEAVIPEAGISNWYEYYRYNGLNVPAYGWQGDDIDILAEYCFSRAKDPDDMAKVEPVFRSKMQEIKNAMDRLTANYNDYWDEKNTLKKLENVKAAVLIVHGINDWNVKMNQCVPLYERLHELGKPVKLMLHQGDHIYVYSLKDAPVLNAIEQWLDYYLKGSAKNGVPEMGVYIESALDQSKWRHVPDWRYGVQGFEMPVENRGEAAFTDDLDLTVYDRGKDNGGEWLDQLVDVSDEVCEDGKIPGCLRFDWTVPENSRLAVRGSVKVRFSAAIDSDNAILSAMLVDIGRERRLTVTQKELSSGEFMFTEEEEPSEYSVISRGWLCAQNRSGLREKKPVVPGEFFTYEFEMIPAFRELIPGHKLRLIVYGTDPQCTERPYKKTEIRVDTSSLLAVIPLEKL